MVRCQCDSPFLRPWSACHAEIPVHTKHRRCSLTISHVAVEEDLRCSHALVLFLSVFFVRSSPEREHVTECSLTLIISGEKELGLS